MVRPELGRVLDSIDGEGLGDDEEGLGVLRDGQLLSGGERGGEVLQVDGEGGLHAAATHHHGLRLQDLLK